MFSLQNLINKVWNNKYLTISCKKLVVIVLKFLVSCVNFGVIYNLNNFKHFYHNIFVFLYLSAGQFKVYYFKHVVNFIIIEYLEVLISSYLITYRQYTDFIIFAGDMELSWRHRVNFLKDFVETFYNVYKWKYGHSKVLYLINLNIALIKILAKIAWKMFYHIIIEEKYIQQLISGGIDTFHYISLCLEFSCLTHIYKFIGFWYYPLYKNVENISRLILTKRIFWGKVKNPWVNNFISFYFGILKLYNLVRNVFLPIIVSLTMIFILINFFKIEIYTNIGIWATLGFFFLWLMSGFNFFVKRYKNGKFTSAIQRFWKRTNAYFWLVEGFLFLLFFYYYLNSSQEPLYMYDESNLNQNFLPNLTTFYSSILILLVIIFYSYYLLLNLSTFSFKQQLLHLLVNSTLMIYVFLLESYQFYFLLNTFFEVSWDYVEDIKTWILNTENPKIRVKTQYLMLALIAKYWHFIFIFFSWVFLLYKSYEKKKVHYSLFGFVIQNSIILILLNLLFCIQWGKWLIRRYYDVIYYWFFTDTNKWVLTDFTESFTLLFGF